MATLSENSIYEQAVDEQDDNQADDTVVDRLTTSERIDAVQQTEHQHDDAHHLGGRLNNVHGDMGRCKDFLQ
jgi:hypothetical protein